MALKAILDTLDGLDDTLKGEYVAKGDKFELQVEGMRTEGDVARVTEALRKENRDLSATLDQSCEFGGNPIV